MKKRRLVGKLLIAAVISVIIYGSIINKMDNLYLSDRINKFLQKEENRRKAYLAAVELHYGDPTNTCVYFTSEVLRRNNYDVPDYIANTSQFISFLEQSGWEKEFDMKKLKLGDICFTTDAYDNKQGIPTHTYVFMGWVEKGNYDYAYICDNQARDYGDKVYHIRNVSITDYVDGNKKEAFSFFMKTP